VAESQTKTVFVFVSTKTIFFLGQIGNPNKKSFCLSTQNLKNHRNKKKIKLCFLKKKIHEIQIKNLENQTKIPEILTKIYILFCLDFLDIHFFIRNSESAKQKQKSVRQPNQNYYKDLKQSQISP
jgi:hypothetical protein